MEKPATEYFVHDDRNADSGGHRLRSKFGNVGRSSWISLDQIRSRLRKLAGSTSIVLRCSVEAFRITNFPRSPIYQKSWAASRKFLNL